MAAEFWRVVRSNYDLLVEILLRVVLFCLFRYLESYPPHYRTIKHEELWLYKNPVTEHDTVPTTTLYLLSLGIPSAFIITHYLSSRQYVDFRQAFLTLTLTAPLNGLIINLIKISVGRPRPDFFYRCFPDGEMTFDLECSGPAALVEEGRKSFPSGHSAWIFSCFGFLSLYMLGKLQCLRASGRGEGWRLCMAITPLVAAMLVALTRLQDFKHHWEDVLVGMAIGSLIALLCYCHYYPPPWTNASHAPYPPQGFPCPPNTSNPKFITSPNELEVDCEKGGVVDVSSPMNGSKRTNRKI